MVKLDDVEMQDSFFEAQGFIISVAQKVSIAYVGFQSDKQPSARGIIEEVGAVNQFAGGMYGRELVKSTRTWW